MALLPVVFYSDDFYPKDLPNGLGGLSVVSLT